MPAGRRSASQRAVHPTLGSSRLVARGVASAWERFAGRLLAAGLALGAGQACATVAPPVVDRALEASGLGVLVVAASPVGVTVFLDDRPAMRVGSAPTALTLAPGSYRLRAEAEGYLTERFDVSVVAGQTVDLSLTMWPVGP